MLQFLQQQSKAFSLLTFVAVPACPSGGAGAIVQVDEVLALPAVLTGIRLALVLNCNATSTLQPPHLNVLGTVRGTFIRSSVALDKNEYRVFGGTRTVAHGGDDPVDVREHLPVAGDGQSVEDLGMRHHRLQLAPHHPISNTCRTNSQVSTQNYKTPRKANM